ACRALVTDDLSGPHCGVLGQSGWTCMPDHPHAHGHDHSHRHAHGHHHAPARHDRAFAIGVALNGGFVIAEVGFGIAANSMALLSDAAHNLGDALALLLAWGAVW